MIDTKVGVCISALLLMSAAACSEPAADDGDHGFAVEDTTMLQGTAADTALLPEAPAVLEEQAEP